MATKESTVLAIGGFDPCGGAGVLADIQTLLKSGVRGMAVLTAITAQHENMVNHVDWQTDKEIAIQLKPLSELYHFEIVKIGIVEKLDTLSQILTCLDNYWSIAKVVWDPVLKSSSGFRFFEMPDGEQLFQILERIYLITPNQMEYKYLNEILDGCKIPCNVLLKSEPCEGNNTNDRLIYSSGKEALIVGNTIEGKDKHGTGCILSSAIAATLSQGKSLVQACQYSKKYIEAYLMSGKNRLGNHNDIKL